jgi:hypothetical protein
LNAGTFAPETASAANAKNARDELHPHDTPGHESEIFPKRQLELGYATARRFRTKSVEKKSNDQRATCQERETSSKKDRVRSM